MNYLHFWKQYCKPMLPCSRCGSDDVDFVNDYREDDDDWRMIAVRCNNCWYEVNTDCGERDDGYEEAAVDGWNEANKVVDRPRYSLVLDKDGDPEAIALGNHWQLDLNPGASANKLHAQEIVDRLNSTLNNEQGDEQ